MVTYKILLDERRVKSDGTYPVIIRVTCNRQVRTINSGTNIQRENWDMKCASVKGSYPNAQLINRKTTEFYLKVQKIVLEGEEMFDFATLKERLSLSYKPKKAIKATFKSILSN